MLPNPWHHRYIIIHPYAADSNALSPIEAFQNTFRESSGNRKSTAGELFDEMQKIKTMLPPKPKMFPMSFTDQKLYFWIMDQKWPMAKDDQQPRNIL